MYVVSPNYLWYNQGKERGVREMSENRFVIITGLSGAGKTQAMRCFEDLGYFCIDNLPPTLIPKFAELCLQSNLKHIALVVDIRGGEFFDSIADALKSVEELGINPEIVFLEADDRILIRRFKSPEGAIHLLPQEACWRELQARGCGWPASETKPAS